MKARLNLTIDEQLLISVKKIADKNDTSVSEMVTRFFIDVVRPNKKKNLLDILDEMEPSKIDPKVDLKELYYKEQGEEIWFLKFSLMQMLSWTFS